MLRMGPLLAGQQPGEPGGGLLRWTGGRGPGSCVLGGMISLIVALVLFGLLLYVVSALPIDGTIKRIIHVVIVVCAVLYALQGFGFIGREFPRWR